MKNIYQVKFIGVNKKWAKREAVAKLAKLLKTTDERVEIIVNAGGCFVAKDVSEDVALKYKSAIEGCGGVCLINKKVIDDIKPNISEDSLNFLRKLKEYLVVVIN